MKNRKVVKSSKDSLSRAFSLKRTTAANDERNRTWNRSPKNGQEETESVAGTVDNETNQERAAVSNRNHNKSNSIGNNQGGESVTNAFNTLISSGSTRLESASNSLVSSAQKHKQNLFAKLESHSLSLSSALFGGSSSVSSGGSCASREQQQQLSFLEDPFEEDDIMMATNTATEATGSHPTSTHSNSKLTLIIPIFSHIYAA